MRFSGINQSIALWIALQKRALPKNSNGGLLSEGAEAHG